MMAIVFFLTVPLQRSAGLYRTCQGEMLSLRNVCHQDVEMSPKVRPLLYFDDGGKKRHGRILESLGAHCIARRSQAS